MDISQLPEPLRARIAEREARSTMEKARSILQSYVEDSDGTDEIRDELLATARYNNHFLRQELSALEEVLTQELPAGTLFRMVSVDGGWSLDHDPTDEGAAVFLRQLAGWVRAAIEQAERESGHQ